METMMDTLYVEIQNTTMPRKVKQALLTQVSATNQSLQVFFEVSRSSSTHHFVISFLSGIQQN